MTIGIDNSLLPVLSDSGQTGTGNDWLKYSAVLTQAAGGLTSGLGSYYQAQGFRSQIAGTKLQMQGQKSQFLGSQISLNYQAHMAALNATLAEMSASAALDQGQRQEQQVQMATGQMLGTQRAGMAAHGIDLSSATPVNVMATTKAMGEVDANTVHLNAIRNAWGLRMQATDYQNQALLDTAGAKGAGLMADAINPGLMDKVGGGASPGLAMAGTILGAVGSVASSWYGYAGKT